MFWQILLPSLGKLNGYVTHIYSKYVDLDRSNRTCQPGWEEVAECN